MIVRLRELDCSECDGLTDGCFDKLNHLTLCRASFAEKLTLDYRNDVQKRIYDKKTFVDLSCKYCE